MSGSEKTAALVISLLGALLSMPVAAAGIESQNFTIYLILSSDYVFRGYTQTDGNPAFQAGVDFEHPSGVLAGLWASNVDFPPREGSAGRGDIEVYAYVGYGVELGRETTLALTVDRYEYPDDASRFGYSYTEIGVALRHLSTSFSAAYASDALGSGESGVALELVHLTPLPWKLQLGAGVGFYDLEAAFLSDYLYWNVELTRVLGRFQVLLGYYDTDDRGKVLWKGLAGSRVIVGLGFRIL